MRLSGCPSCSVGIWYISRAVATAIALMAHRMAVKSPTGYTWATTGQSPEAKRFFPKMAAETGAAFTAHGPSCQHMGLNRPAFSAGGRPVPRTVIERDI
jgi:ABC-type uncharacterized transport system permease subunit